MRDRGEEELYVGYLPQAPPGVARFVRRLVVAILVGAGGLAVVLAALQRPFGPGVFEYGEHRAFVGRIEVDPLVSLVSAEPEGSQEARRSYLLVGRGKHGAPAELEGLVGETARIDGFLIQRGETAMIEVASVEPLGEASAASRVPPVIVETAVEHSTGEVVDMKCYLGAMKPGRGKEHRACAVRCLSGGVPAGLRVDGEGGGERVVPLVDGGRRATHDEVVARAGERVEARGRLLRRGELIVLEVESLEPRRR